MTHAEIELMLANLAELKRYHRETSRLVRAAAAHVARIDAAITARLAHLLGDEEGRA